MRSQLNQIRLWVRQGRTDAWIAHKLDISVDQLRTFKREQGLNGEAEPASPPPPLDEVDIDEVDLDGRTEEAKDVEGAKGAVEQDYDAIAAHVDTAEEELEGEDRREQDAEAEREREPRRRRRGRRGGRRRGRTADSFEATFDHGDEGYGLWLDPAVAENDVYTEHWAGHRAVSVILEPDAITIRRVDREGRSEDDAG